MSHRLAVDILGCVVLFDMAFILAILGHCYNVFDLGEVFIWTLSIILWPFQFIKIILVFSVPFVVGRLFGPLAGFLTFGALLFVPIYGFAHHTRIESPQRL